MKVGIEFYTIEAFDSSFAIYHESGVCVEDNFSTYEEAERWATHNGYNLNK